MRKYIYFDNAATTVNKPDCVINSAVFAMQNLANPGRSGHDLSLYAASEIFECRKEICRLFGYDKPENVIFTYNATYALNIAIKGFAKNNSHIIISSYEHNSVIRPVHALASDEKNKISYSVFDASLEENALLCDFSSKIRPDTEIAVVTLASNVCGKIMPIAKISEICKKKGIILICDAAQGAGCVPVNIKSLGVDVLCFAGHKSLYGPQGVGGAVFCTDRKPKTLIEGGNGANSANPGMDGPMPESLEAGTLNTPGICALKAGIKYISKIGIEEIYERNLELIDRLTENLSSIQGVKLYGLSSKRTPTLLFNVRDLSSEAVASILNENNVCVRSGFHCAPKAHMQLKTGENGAVRASLSFTNTKKEIDAFSYYISRI
ncbi:MAG: aminotransferase class V-fold PLP-dependent enzyme [Clostridiales bacterium]|nr:aminotransferase class V-fold PLP-dependent enzyme [Clostridiales bacterium]